MRRAGLLALCAVQPRVGQQSARKAHVAHIQHKVRSGQPQAFDGQAQHLARAVEVHIAQKFHAQLADLGKFMVGGGETVYAFMVVQLFHLPPLRPRPLDDGQRHIRPEGHELAACASEAEHAFAGEKALVFQIECVLLKAAHGKARIAIAFIQAAQAEHQALLGAEHIGNGHGTPPSGMVDSIARFNALVKQRNKIPFSFRSEFFETGRKRAYQSLYQWKQIPKKQREAEKQMKAKACMLMALLLAVLVCFGAAADTRVTALAVPTAQDIPKEEALAIAMELLMAHDDVLAPRAGSYTTFPSMASRRASSATGKPSLRWRTVAARGL